MSIPLGKLANKLMKDVGKAQAEGERVGRSEGEGERDRLLRLIVDMGKVETRAMQVIDRLRVLNADLLEACKELREACAAAFRVINRNNLEQEYEKECPVPYGFGVRAQKAIARAEQGRAK